MKSTANLVPSQAGPPTTAFPSPVDRARWRAVLARDQRHDGTFVFAVGSTGIYCRPSCPARRPKREGVRFYLLPEQAEGDGYRACRRCRPREAAARNPHVEMVRRVCAILDGEHERVPTLADLGARVGLSPFHLQRMFRRATGMTPREYTDARRIGRFKELLQRKESITMATYEAGYGSSSRLYEKTPTLLGMTPKAYRRGGAGLDIRYATAPSPLGRLLVAATPRGVCAVKLGDKDAPLIAALRREFPEAALGRDAGGLRRATATLVRALRGGAPRVDLPLDIRATAFQWKVWRALLAIPQGETRTYRQIAAIVGAPRAPRAVGRACATNPVAIAIPCHRVIREDGGLGGYAYGIGRKRRLIETERLAAARREKASGPARRGRAGQAGATRLRSRDRRSGTPARAIERESSSPSSSRTRRTPRSPAAARPQR
jgi:AraC family transcriptional regulator of adaptative response/methylated-DNA-[protein]-cysteine methyltransferase